MKVKHLLWLSLATIWGKINWWAYIMLSTEDPNVIVDPMDTLAVLVFIVDAILVVFIILNFSDEIGDFWDKIKDKPIITPKKKRKS